MSRRTRRPLVLSGIETLEQRQMLHGGVASEPKTALLHLVDDGRDVDKLATARQHHAAQIARVAEARAQAHQRHLLVHEQSLHVKATASTARDHAAAAHAAVLRVTAAHPAKHVPAKHHKPHAKAKHHAKPITITPVATPLGWGKLIGSVVTTATTGSSGTRISSPAITTNSIAAPVTAPPVSVASITPVTPATVTTTAAPRTLAVGEVLDTKIIPGGIAGPGVSYLITPQPLPANMTFDRTTGAISFRPAPGQEEHYLFTVTAQGGAFSAAVVVPINVTPAAEASTEVSGRAVDELGLPLAGMTVAIGTSTTSTDALGRFLLTGLPANPGPLIVGGQLASAQSRQGIYAPVDELMGRALFAKANNVLPTDLILPKIHWSGTESFAGALTAVGGDPSKELILGNTAAPGFAIRTVPGVSGAVVASGTLRVSQLSAADSAQHMPSDGAGGMFLYESQGIDLTKPVMLSLPNSNNLRPGTTMQLLMLNMTTGGRDVVGQLLVSADGRTLDSVGPVVIGHPVALGASPGPQTVSKGDGPTTNEGPPSLDGGAGTGPAIEPNNACLLYLPAGGTSSNPFQCSCGSNSSGGATPPGSLGPAPPPVRRNDVQTNLDSDADYVTGDYRLDHATVAYQSQGQGRDIDLAYSSLQANPHQAVQFLFTPPFFGSAASITSVTAQVTLGGVSQGPAVTYITTPNGLDGDQTYAISLPVDATALGTGSFPYRITYTENFSSSPANPVSVTRIDEGFLNVVDRSASALGAGWSINGLQQITQAQPGGPVLLNEGQTGTTRYNPVYSNGGLLQDLATSQVTTQANIAVNDGTGGFTAPIAPTSGSTTIATVAGDYNGDGRPDLAVLGASTLVVQPNNGAGAFGAATTINLPAGSVGRALAAGNFTGHTTGTLDLAVVLANTSTGTYAVAIYTGAGNGTFAAPVVTQAGNGAYQNNAPLANTVAVADYNGDGRPDLAFTTDEGLADVMLAAGTAGAFGAASALTLPTGDVAIAVAATDYNGDGAADLVLGVNNTSPSSYPGYNGPTLVGLVAYKGLGNGTFTAQGSYISNGFNNYTTLGIVVGQFHGPSNGLEVGLPVGSDDGNFVYFSTLSPAGVFGLGTPVSCGDYNLNLSGRFGNIVAGDFNGAGRPSIALSDGTENIKLLLADADSNNFLKFRSVKVASGFNYINGSISYAGMLAAAPFAGNAATPGFRGTPSQTAGIAHNGNGTWTRSYPDGTVVQFDAQGREVSETDRNNNTTTFAYVPAGQPGAGALKTMTDPVGLVTTLAYNAAGKLATITDPAGRVTTVVVDGNGNLTKVTDPDGAIEQYGYATPSDHRATTETNADGNTATAHYNIFGQFTSETLFNGTSTTQVAAAQAQGILAPGQSTTGVPTYQATITDALNRTTTIGMNRGSHPSGVTDGAGGSSSMTYDIHGRVASSNDALQRTTYTTFDDQGNLTSLTIPGVSYTTGYGGGAGWSPGSYSGPATTTIAYNNPFSIPTSITDFIGRITTFTLDPRGNVLRRTDPDGLHEDWTYNAAGQPLSDTSRAGNTTSYAYDARGRLTTVTDPGPSSTGSGSPHVTLGYNNAGDVTSMTDERGNTLLMTYDQAGRVLTAQDPIQAANNKATHYAYDPAGKLLSVTDANGGVTTFTYDKRNRVVTMTDPVHQGTGTHASYGYDAVGNLTSTTDMRGYTTTYTYDGVNRFASVTDAANELTSYTYDLDGELTRMVDPRGNVALYDYDARGNMVRLTLPGYSDPTGPGNGQSSGSGSGSGSSSGTPSPYATSNNGTGQYTFAYYDDGQLGYRVDPLNHGTSWSYNNLGLPAGTTDALSHITGRTYDADLNQATMVDGLGHATSMVYDSRDRLISQTDPAGGGTTSYTYDDASNLLSVTDPVGNVTRYTYDANNRRATETMPTGGVTTYTYDVVGNLTQKVDPNNRTTQYSYDADNREITEKWLPAGGGAAFYTMTLAYDANGDVASVQDNFSHYVYAYDAVNRVTSIDNTGTPGSPQVTLTYSYDKNGNRTNLGDSLGGTDSYAYNARNQLDLISQSGTSSSNVAPELVFFNYDQAGNLTSQSRYSDIAANSKVATTGYVYDVANRLTSLAHTKSGGAAIASYGYTLDAANRLTSEAHAWNGGNSTDTIGYGYTNNDQLTAVNHTNSAFANESFSYDTNGNRNASGQTTTTGNEIQSDGTSNYTYDAAGNLATKTNIATGNTTLYKWDYRNRLAEVDSVVGGQATVTAVFTYDALNRQISERDYPTSGSATVAATFVGDSGFEAIGVGSGGGSYVYNPSGSAWTFVGNAGISGNGSAFTNGDPNAPAGSQVAFLQTTGTISQSVTFAAAGSYQLSFQSIQRVGNQQDFQVLVDGNVVGTFQPTGSSYQFFATSSFTASAGSHTITFKGLNTIGGDNTAFLDAVNLVGLATSTPAGASATRWTVYDDQTPLLDFNGSGQQTARYLSIPGAIDELLARQTASGVAWYLDDRLGSVREIVDNSGTVLDHVDYSVYGQVSAESAPAQGDRFKFAGMELDAAISLYYDRSRYYDPAAGRFVGQDPLGLTALEYNLYRYSNNSPGNFVDKTGLSSADCLADYKAAVRAAEDAKALEEGRIQRYLADPKNNFFGKWAIAALARSKNEAAYYTALIAAEAAYEACIAANELYKWMPLWETCKIMVPDLLPKIPRIPDFPRLPVPPGWPTGPGRRGPRPIIIVVPF